MATVNYQIDRTAEGGMTTYRVAGMTTPDNAAIYQALTEAAKDAWQYLTTTPGTYTADQLCKAPIDLRDGAVLPNALKTACVVCGTSTLRVGLVDENGRPNYCRLFFCLAKFEKLARIAQNDRCMFTIGKDMGKLECEARVVLPDNMKAICDCCGDDPVRVSVNYPAIDLDRRCIVATDCFLMVARKFTLVSIHYEDKVPETFYLPMEVARMSGEVTVKLYEKGCTVIDQKGNEVSVEHEARYPKWHTVWSKWRGGTTVVDARGMKKLAKVATNGLPQRGKSKSEAILLAHYPASDNLRICGYDGAKMVNDQRMEGCVAADEVAWRVPVSPVRLLKMLAFNPKMMWAGYSEYSAMPDRIIMEDGQSDTAIMLMTSVGKEISDALRETEKEFSVGGQRGLYHCYGDDGWLLEQIETKYPTCGTPEPPKPSKVFLKSASEKMKNEERRVKNDALPSETISAISAISAGRKEPSIADRLRAALRARLAA